MTTRRQFLFLPAALAAAAPKLGHKERVDRALRGEDVDRPPFSFWYHFGLQKFPAERHANATLRFHRKFRTDIVKVMSDFPYPKPKGNWYDPVVVDDPFPEQIRALEMIREGLGGKAHFVETIFNPWNVAEKLSSKEEVQKLKSEKPQVLLDALEAIAKSEANHARRTITTGASGIFLAIANAGDGVLDESGYAKFSEPFDRMVLEAASGAPLNTLHLHGAKIYLDRFWKGWQAPVVNYSAHGAGVGIAAARSKYDGVIMGGIDEQNYRTLTPAQLKEQWRVAQQAAGKKFFLAPGCSVPNETTDRELMNLVRVLGA